MPSMNFVLTGRDALSRVLDRAGDASDRLGRRLLTMSINSDAAVRRFTNNASRNLAGLQRDTDAGGKALEALKKTTLLLAPAAIPAAASLAPIAAGAGTVAVAVAAMGAALGPQISALGDAADAEKKYQDAVDKSGATSQQAVQAQIAYAQVVAKLPPATREAAAAVGVLKDNYKEWSNSLAGDTMAPFTKGVALANALLPKTTGLVKAASGETDRFITIVGGEMASPGLDRLNTKFTSFAQSTLRKVNDEIVHLLRVGEGGQGGGAAREFMEWARAQGPAVAAVLSSVAASLVHVLQAGSGVGVGLLQVVQVLADLVSAVPPGAIAVFLQLALALKLTKAAALGLAAGRTALAGFAAQVVAMNTAAAAAPGRLAALRAGIAALSRTTKVALAGTGIGLLVLALGELASMGKSASPDVDKLTSSLRELGNTGKVTGEAAKHFGSGLDGLYDKVRSLTDPSTLDKVQQFLVGWSGWDSTPVKEAKENLNSVDEALASLVRGGQSDLAAAALKRLTAEYGKGGRDTKAFAKELDAYKSAVADAKFEQDLAAQSMGLFGSQAQKVQAQLDAQKRSTDGLRQSIQALNDVQRAGLGGMIGFEAAIDNAAKAAQENAGALDMAAGRLNLNSERARAAATALQDLASKTDEAAASARESGSSWETVNGIYTRGRTALIKNAQAMGLSRAEAAQLADQILRIPDKTATVKMNAEDAKRDLDAFNAKVRASPGVKSVTLKTLSGSAEQVLAAFGYKVTHLKDGSVTVRAVTGGAIGQIRNVQGAVNALRGKTIGIGVYTTEYYKKVQQGGGSSGPQVPGYGKARGGFAPGFADGGMPSGLLRGPGTGLSDSIPMWWAANGEYVVNARSTAKYLPLIEAINRDRLGMGSGMPGAGSAVAAGLASGMTGGTGAVEAAARTMAAAVVTGVKDELEIASPSKKTKALAKDVGAGFIAGLTGSRDKIKSVAADLAKDIKTAFTGKKEASLLKAVDRQTKRLLDAAAKRDALAKKIADAKAYAADVTRTARDQASLSSLGMDAEQVTAGTIKGGLAGKLAQVKQFTRFVEVLAKRGLTKGLIRQILNMGPEQGYAYANALAGADKSTIASINRTQSAIDSESKKLGTRGADILYDSGKHAGKGFLTGLQSQQKAIEKLILAIATGMQKSIRKALGIKSPSTVMAKLGAYSTEGLARGILAAAPQVDRSMAAISGRVSGIQPVLGRAAVTGRAGGGTVVHIHVDGAVVDTLGFARAAREALLELKRAHGFADLGIA